MGRTVMDRAIVHGVMLPSNVDGQVVMTLG